MSQDDSGYRASHATAGSGRCYIKTYEVGYYADLWRRIEGPLLEQLLLRLSKQGRNSCLDFACGTGRITAVVERYFERCHAIDVSDEMLSIARSSCSRAVLERRDVTQQPMTATFDVITAFRFFLNAEPTLRRAVLREFRRMITDNGRIVINVHVNRTSLLGVLYRMRNWMLGRTVANTIGHRELRQLIEEADFCIEQTYWYGLYPRTGWHLNWLTRKLMGPAESLFRNVSWLPRSWAQSFIVVCAPIRTASDRRQQA